MLLSMTMHEKMTLDALMQCKRAGRKFSVLTCYDARTAAIMESAGVEVLLVGDTSAEVVLGLPTTREMPVEFLLTVTSAVRRGAPHSHVMADLPFAWRQGDIRTVTDWVRHLYQETGSDSVKVEVTGQDAALVESIRDAGVPVVAHLGLLPQQVDPSEGYRARGRDAVSARQLIEDARRLEDAGAAMLLVEAVASEVAREITTHASIPVIGCAAGPHCDGTVVVLHDMLGWGGGHPPRGVKQYLDLSRLLGEAFVAYVADIHAGRFPQEADAIHMKPGEYEKLTSLVGEG
ncbi:MAG TPA: 3-methyl-2-oxobutanoate hydroxymethyltransferase [Phycisphaerae bacterium]|nr:3-methyl-2-oxobutanoate hydroxymethyltransferase [Phycisphaerae bacterium]HOJ75669.1 3-methyl-2-oxobutanoate hydroxymethyltransferase [Phycisphaerae bacterium]HOM52537.1 3-methyl-2-oxobutanoate hydroxymethyltransferase [Phycisphaerae bacterium]HON66413.1 3-methyl-2-oxobutanoate hydroxymethyltransferase [Phycisphaerae bacterium]HPP27811.1 3-methyl-2-oxobutanoate hydroxymethyltransferase [Phycisphaerae bacterium]